MNAIASHARFYPSKGCRVGSSLTAAPDPLDDDAAGDEAVAVTRRSLVRLALVAAETGARFQRDGIAHDPMAWLLAPRRLFAGRSPLDAVLGRDDCLRAVLLHGLGLELDVGAEEIDELLADGEDAPAAVDGGSAADREGGVVAAAAPRLFTATLADPSDVGGLLAFDAMVCGSSDELRDRISARVGVELANMAEVREGFVASAPIVEALVSDAVADMLAQVEAAPTSSLAAGLEVVVQQRFSA